MKHDMKRALAVLLLLLTTSLAACSVRDLTLPGGDSPTPTATPDATQSAAPFALPGRPITSPDGIAYTFYSGKTASFDGLPLAVDVTIPAGARRPLPLVVMLHDWGQSRVAWESQTITTYAPNTNGWNNVAFAARGFAVLTYTARGWHDSCGPDDASAHDDPTTLPAACAARRYWTHLADPRWEVRDAQTLIGTLVDEGIADPAHIGVTGGSYGGAQAWMLALLNDRMMSADGTLVPWRSPNGAPLHIAAAATEYTWASLAGALLPNGRASDADGDLPALSTLSATASYTNPVGVPLQSYLAALYAEGPTRHNGFYSPAGADPTADLTAWYTRLTIGAPFRNDATTDPIVARALAELELRSPLAITPDAEVPVFQVQGTTDPLFPPVQALLLRNHVLTWHARYPIKSFFGDMGHANANNPADVWALANATGRAFFDYYLAGRGDQPGADVTLMTTTCLGGQVRRTMRASNWPALAHSTVTFTSTDARTTSDTAAGLEGSDADPIAHGGCLSARGGVDSGVAAWTFPVAKRATLVGQPRIALSFTPSGSNAELNVRLWDVSSSGAMQALMSRGTYSYVGPAGAPVRVTFQIVANGWEVLPGHSLRLEVTGNDTPYLQADTMPALVSISAVSLTLPVAEVQ